MPFDGLLVSLGLPFPSPLQAVSASVKHNTIAVMKDSLFFILILSFRILSAVNCHGWF